MKNKIALFFLVSSITLFSAVKCGELLGSRDLTDSYIRASDLPKSIELELVASTEDDMPEEPTNSVQEGTIDGKKTQDYIFLNPASVHIGTENDIPDASTNSVEEGAIDDKTTFGQIDTDLNQEKITVLDQKESASKLFGISFDKKQLIGFGVGAVALIVICGVTYVLYKNGTLKKAGDYIGDLVVEHKFAVGSGISAVCAIVLTGIYAKQQGMTLQNNWITSFLVYNKSN